MSGWFGRIDRALLRRLLRVPCPACGAPVGGPCWPGPWPHLERIETVQGGAVGNDPDPERES